LKFCTFANRHYHSSCQVDFGLGRPRACFASPQLVGVHPGDERGVSDVEPWSVLCKLVTISLAEGDRGIGHMWCVADKMNGKQFNDTNSLEKQGLIGARTLERACANHEFWIVGLDNVALKLDLERLEPAKLVVLETTYGAPILDGPRATAVADVKQSGHGNADASRRLSDKPHRSIRHRLRRRLEEIKEAARRVSCLFESRAALTALTITVWS